MPNSNAPFGFMPTRRIDGADISCSINGRRIISKSDTVKISRGDVVKSLSTGYIALAGVNDSPVFGVFQGCQYFDTSLQQWVFSPQWNGSTTASADPTAFVIADVKQVFEVQSSGATITFADIGQNAKFTGNGAPNISGYSVAAIDQTTLATTATLPFRIVGLSTKVDNDNASSYNSVEVILNSADFNQLTGV